MTDTQPIGDFEYIRPNSLCEAFELLQKKDGGIKILAGGTDLIIQIKRREITPTAVLDIKNIPELNRLEWDKNSGLHIGAAVPLNKLLGYAPLKEKFSLIAQACGVIGSMQIKNRGTVGGNICNAAPSADSAPALLCMNAKILLASSDETRSVDLQDFFTGPGKTSMRNGELVTGIEVPNPPDDSVGCYLRHTLREEMDISTAGVAVMLVFSPEKAEIKEARIALGAVAPTPMRARGAESVLAGKPLTVSAIEAASVKAAEEARPVTDLRASAEYRRELVKVLTRRALRIACESLDIL